jgi:hypothetical protein
MAAIIEPDRQRCRGDRHRPDCAHLGNDPTRLRCRGNKHKPLCKHLNPQPKRRPGRPRKAETVASRRIQEREARRAERRERRDADVQRRAAEAHIHRSEAARQRWARRRALEPQHSRLLQGGAAEYLIDTSGLGAPSETGSETWPYRDTLGPPSTCVTCGEKIECRELAARLFAYGHVVNPGSRAHYAVPVQTAPDPQSVEGKRIASWRAA